MSGRARFEVTMGQETVAAGNSLIIGKERGINSMYLRFFSENCGDEVFREVQSGSVDGHVRLQRLCQGHASLVAESPLVDVPEEHPMLPCKSPRDRLATVVTPCRRPVERKIGRTSLHTRTRTRTRTK